MTARHFRGTGFLGLGIAAAAAAALAILPGCNDDPAAPGDGLPFSLAVTVQTAAGAPVRGLEFSLEVPLLGVGSWSADKSAAVVSFCVTEARDIDLSVYDLDGGLVRTLLNGYSASPGEHQVIFDGKDDAGEPLVGTVVLDFLLEARDPADGSLAAAAGFRSVLYTGMDAERRPSLGVTDYQGRIVTTDRSLFPFLRELGDLTVYSENAESLGTFTVSDTIRLFINDPIAHLAAQAEFRITDGPNAFTMTWPPGAQAFVEAGGKPPVGADRGPAVEPYDGPVPGCATTLLVFPNPFN